eukprot:m.213941 g.213941  ORF g.213941 m.213941 type:complete len:65 (-) comp13796_c0_seq1:605-799(-)
MRKGFARTILQMHTVCPQVIQNQNNVFFRFETEPNSIQFRKRFATNCCKEKTAFIVNEFAHVCV